VVKLKLSENSPCFVRWKSDIQSSWLMGVQLVKNHSNDLHFNMNFVHQPFHTVGKILHCMAFGGPDMSLTSQRFKEKVQISHTITFIFVIVTFSQSRFGRQANPSLLNQLFKPFIKTDQWVVRIIGLFILIKHIFHASHILRACFGNAPHLFLPWLYVVF
jgi:hypothetical protein